MTAKKPADEEVLRDTFPRTAKRLARMRAEIEPAVEEAVREWVAAHQERRKLAVDMTWGDQEKALNALEAALGAPIRHHSCGCYQIVVAAIRGALEGEHD